MRLDRTALLLSIMLASPAVAQSPDHVLTPNEVQALLDSKAVTAKGDPAGEVDNLLIRPDGEVAAVVLEWGQRFGLGEKKAVVPWDEVALAPSRDAVVVDLTRDQLEALPQYDPDVPAAAGVDPDIKPVR